MEERGTEIEIAESQKMKRGTVLWDRTSSSVVGMRFVRKARVWIRMEHHRNVRCFSGFHLHVSSRDSRDCLIEIIEATLFAAHRAR